MSQREYDGRANYSADDDIEKKLEEHFEKYSISKRELVRNFQIYARRVFLKRFLSHYQLYMKTVNLPGDIVELGVYRGLSLMSWANFLEIHNMGDRAKQVIGFDNWAGFKSFSGEDGAEDPRVNKIIGGYNGGEFKEILDDAIKIYDADRFIPHKPRIILVDGDIEESVPKFINENPGLTISLLHIDCDLYRPTKIAMENLWDRLVKGGVLILDDYGIRPWEGETRAINEFFEERDVKIMRFEWSHFPGAFVVK